MQKKDIIFEPSTPYFQEQNGVSDRIEKTIMDMTRIIILEDNIDDNLWPELMLVTTHIKNNWPTRAIQDQNSYELYTYKRSDLIHFRILGSTIYVFLYEEEQMLKSEKWALRALKRTLVGYNSHTIYWIYL